MRETSRSIAAIALLAAVALGGDLAACNTEPTCDKAADRVLELIKQQTKEMLTKFPEGQRKQIEKMAEKSLPRERLVEECTKNFTKEQIACTVAAKSLEDASKCNQSAAPLGGQPAPSADPNQPTPGASPAGGGNDTGGAPGAAPQGQAPAAAPQGETPAADPSQPAPGTDTEKAADGDTAEGKERGG
jgi:hypothetical protein